jgi:tetratricopeptide (TPR) repeat protein
MAASVQNQMATEVALLRRTLEDSASSTDALGAAYGRMGILLAAAEQLDAAEPSYLNAQQLQPNDPRWPYYLGHLYRIRGPIASAAASFERTLQLKPNDVASTVWLGEVYLTQGRVDEADPLFSRVLQRQPQLVPALFGAGRVALARNQYALAIKLLEQCLVLDPRGTAAHYPLGMAYRGMGTADLAQAHIAQQGDVRIQPVDPLMAALDEVLESPRAYDIRGGRALETGDWPTAAAQFRKGLELNPSDPVIRLRLGTALFQMGDAGGAQEQFERVLEASPTYARAHYSLGILALAGGRFSEAKERLTNAVKFGPDDPGARLALAGVLRQDKRPADALPHYEHARKLDPKNTEITLGYVITLAQLGRFRDARNLLESASKAYPGEAEYTHALARLLAAAPEDGVRDGNRALQLVEGLLKAQPSTVLGETLAMALAEVGQFDRAVRVQRDVMAANQKAGVLDVNGALTANLKRYESRQPSRTPWPAN